SLPRQSSVAIWTAPRVHLTQLLEAQTTRRLLPTQTRSLPTSTVLRRPTKSTELSSRFRTRFLPITETTCQPSRLPRGCHRSWLTLLPTPHS
ncbi:hypothetical protein IWW50_002266, partial [Coemansia erecta]